MIAEWATRIKTENRPELRKKLLLACLYHRLARACPDSGEVSCRGVLYSVDIDDYGCPVVSDGLHEALQRAIKDPDRSRRCSDFSSKP